MKYAYGLLSILLIPVPLHSLTLTRVILSTDTHPNYIQFWPLVARAWKKIVGVRPTLALIADESVRVDESCGDVIRFKPIPGVSTAFQAQTIRLLLPALFPQDVCIMSDIDLIPLDKKYFAHSISRVKEDAFVVYRSKQYMREEDKRYNYERYPMCYTAAKGAVYGEIFHIQGARDIEERIKQWWDLQWGWISDELILYKYVHAWPAFNQRSVLLGHKVSRRKSRTAHIKPSDLLQRKFIDYHCPRPYHRYKDTIDRIFKYAAASHR